VTLVHENDDTPNTLFFFFVRTNILLKVRHVHVHYLGS
jgi:hypothetical protein